MKKFRGSSKRWSLSPPAPTSNVLFFFSNIFFLLNYMSLRELLSFFLDTHIKIQKVVTVSRYLNSISNLEPTLNGVGGLTIQERSSTNQLP